MDFALWLTLALAVVNLLLILWFGLRRGADNGLLDAWRSIEPATERLAIVFAHGRYQLTPIAAIATAALR